MKHQNPAMNVTLVDAKKIRDFLNRIGFAVQAIMGNPNPTGEGSAIRCPEANLPDDGEPMNLDFKFLSVLSYYPVAQIRDILTGSPGLSDIKILHKTLWPTSNLDQLAGKFLVVPEVQGGIDAVIHMIADEIQGVAKAPSDVERLGDFIMEHIPGEPSKNEGAVDTAIRILRGTLQGNRVNAGPQSPPDVELEELHHTVGPKAPPDPTDAEVTELRPPRFTKTSGTLPDPSTSPPSIHHEVVD